MSSNYGGQKFFTFLTVSKAKICPDLEIGPRNLGEKYFFRILKCYTGFGLSFWSAVMKIQPFTTLNWVKKDIIAQQIFPAHGTIYFSVTGNKFSVWNCHFWGWTSIYLFKFNNINCRIKSKICSKLTIEVTNFILVSLLLTVTCCSSVFFADFEHVNGRWNTILHWYKFMHFRVRSRNHVTFKTKLYVTTVNNSFQPLPNFCHKELHLRCCIGFGLNIA